MEFVGGKAEPGELKQQALIRECQEELGVQVAVGVEFMEVAHAYPAITVRLTVFQARITDRTVQLLEHHDIRHITAAEIPLYDFCPADQTILQKLMQEGFPSGESVHCL